MFTKPISNVEVNIIYNIMHVLHLEVSLEDILLTTCDVASAANVPSQFIQRGVVLSEGQVQKIPKLENLYICVEQDN